MKITVEIPDSLLLRARRHARNSGRPLRALIEDGLRHVLEGEPQPNPYRIPDHSVGRTGAPNPLDSLTWPELRDWTYGVGAS